MLDATGLREVHRYRAVGSAAVGGGGPTLSALSTWPSWLS
jgi:hypothetical protein